MPKVEIALLGSREHAFTERSLDAALAAIPWDERERVELDVAEDETLGSILKRAGTELRIEAPGGKQAPVPVFVALHDETGRHPFSVSHVLTLVDEDGRARWNVPFEPVTFAQVERAHSAGALAGDPRRLYYVTHPAIGNGVLITFAQFVVGLKVLWDIMQVLSTIEDTLSFGERVTGIARDRLGDANEVLEQRALAWEMRNASPAAVAEMLGQRPWHVADLAELLGVSEAEAGAVLWAFGYAEDETGLWRVGADDPAQMIRPALDEIQLAYSLGHQDFVPTLERRARHYLERGERAPQPYVDAERFGDHLEADRRDAEWREQAFEDDLSFDDELEEETDLPLEHLLVKCACGKDGCTGIAGFGVANGRLKIGFTAPVDHFVIDPMFLAQIAIQTAGEIKDAKNPDDGD